MNNFYKLNIFDILLIITILAVSAGIILFTRIGLNLQLSENSEIVIYHDGELLMNLELDKEQEVHLLNQKMLLEIKDKQIRVKKSDCPRNICAHMGWIKTPGQIIACVPNKILIEIKSGSAPPVDAVAY